jgi:ferric-dicitrate binding protein FerR (iron transport regulator)
VKAAERDARVEAEIAAPLRGASADLDELHRARLVSAIDATLDREDEARAERRRRAETGAPGWRGKRIFLGAGAAAAVVAGLALWIAARPHGNQEQTALPPPGGAVVAAPPAAAPSLLRPYQKPGRDAPAEAPPPTTSLVALRGERTRATIGTRVRLTLVGAGRVSVLAAAREGDIELALDGGRLLVDYDGHAGGTLRVRSPGAVTTVVGTVFAVEVRGAGSRVAVTRGQVRTEDRSGRNAQVTAGTSWTSADGRSAPIPDDVAAALAEHQASWAPSPAAPDRRVVAAHPARPQPPAARPQPRADLEALYAKAEAAMRERSLGEARRTLETIAAHDTRGALGEAALLDLARLALADGDRAEARRVLARLPQPLRTPALAETAAHLRCRAEPPAAGGSGASDPCTPPTD